MVGCLMNNELEMIWKEPVMATSRHCLAIYLEGLTDEIDKEPRSGCQHKYLHSNLAPSRYESRALLLPQPAGSLQWVHPG
jgi:hypothetical protein